MKKYTFVLVGIALALILAAMPVMAGPPVPPGRSGPPGQPGEPGHGPSGPHGKSNKAHLYLFEKDAVGEEAAWDIVPGGAFGKMQYDLTGPTFDFVFNGHRLDPDAEYTLIYYPDPWPGEDLICLGNGTVNEEGNIHIKASPDTGDLPAEGDANYPDGAKIRLVLTADVECEGIEEPYSPSQMTAWNAADYLFEYDLITFLYTPEDSPEL